MFKSRIRGHFRYLRFKTFPMTPRTPQCEVFCPLLSSSKHSGVRRTPSPHFFQVLGLTPTLGQSRVATLSPTRRKRSMSSLTLKIFFRIIAIAFFWILGHFANFVARLTRFQVTGWNPLEGFTKSSCGKLRLGGTLPHPTLERGRVGSPGIRLGRRFSRSSMNLHQNKPPTWLVHIPGHPWVHGSQATGTSDHKTHHGPDSGVCHHHTPYNILCDTPWGLHPNGTNSRDSRNGVPKLSRNRPRWSPGTLGAHNSRLQDRIATRSEPNL
jgi:hypothetical protein